MFWTSLKKYIRESDTEIIKIFTIQKLCGHVTALGIYVYKLIYYNTEAVDDRQWCDKGVVKCF